MNTKNFKKFQKISTNFYQFRSRRLQISRPQAAYFHKFLSISIYFYLFLSILFPVFSAKLTVPDSLIVERTLYLVPQSAQPTCDADSEGKIYYDANDKTLKYCDGSSWKDLAGGGKDKSVATVIVAACDSLDSTLEGTNNPCPCDGSACSNPRADLTCDGVDDQETIQQAIDSLDSSGGAVYLLEGTYNLSDTININKDNVSLIGAGRGTVLSATTPSGNPVVKISKDRVLVSQIKIEREDSHDNIIRLEGANYCVIKNLWLRANDNSSYTISLDSNSHHNIISQVNFYDPGPNYFRALYMTSDDNIISNNILRGEVNLPGENNILSANLLSKERVWVSGNKNIILGNIIKEISSQQGIGVWGGDYNNIVANLIYNCSDDWGIQFAGSECKANLVSSNLLHDNGGGMSIFWTNNSLFVGNMFYNNNKYNFKKEIHQLCGSYNNLYSFNYIYDSDASVYGIYIDPGANDPWGNKGHYLVGNFIDVAGEDDYKIYNHNSALDITYTQKEKITIERQTFTLSSSPATLEAAVTPRGYVVFETGGNNYDLGTSDGSVNAINDGKAIGDLLILEGPSSGSVTIKNGANVKLKGGSDKTLQSEDTLTLLWNGEDWLEIAYSNN